MFLSRAAQHDAQIYTNDASELARSLSRDNSQRTAIDTQEQPAAPMIDRVTARSERPAEQEQGQSLGIGLA